MNSWSQVIPTINVAEIEAFIFQKDWKSLELKARMSRIAEAMKLLLPRNFPTAAKLVKELVEQLEKDHFSKDSFEFMFIPEYIEKNGIEYLKESLDAFEKITQFTSCEFAIRPFIIRYQEETMRQMLSWSRHAHASVRRLSSEGCRSRLPWAMAIPNFKKDAAPILPILENLKADPSLYVRKSVANNLNDISKDHVDLTLKIAKKWYGKNKDTDWVVKHASRTLLKAGHPEIMVLFGYANIQQLKVSSIKVKTPKVKFGRELKFEFSILNQLNKEASTRIEYAIYFLKSNGSQNKKVFKISERILSPKQQLDIQKSHSIIPISTRKYYAGEHGVALIINGIEFAKQPFLLNM